MSHWYLIHGAASTRLTWTRQLKVLPSVTRAELPLLPHTPPDALLPELADWCLRDLHQPSVIVGHSMGGAVAQLMALKSPHLIEGLVLVGTGPYLPVNPTLIQSIKTEPELALQRIAKLSLSRNPDEMLLKKSLLQAATIDPHRAYQEFLACTFFDVRSQLSSVNIPTALIAGSEDRMTPLSLVQEFLSIWPDAPYFPINGAGHMMMLEQPEAFNDILIELGEKFNW